MTGPRRHDAKYEPLGSEFDAWVFATKRVLTMYHNGPPFGGETLLTNCALDALDAWCNYFEAWSGIRARIEHRMATAILDPDLPPYGEIEILVGSHGGSPMRPLPSGWDVVLETTMDLRHVLQEPSSLALGARQIPNEYKFQFRYFKAEGPINARIITTKWRATTLVGIVSLLSTLPPLESMVLVGQKVPSLRMMA